MIDGNVYSCKIDTHNNDTIVEKTLVKDNKPKSVQQPQQKPRRHDVKIKQKPGAMPRHKSVHVPLALPNFKDVPKLDWGKVQTMNIDDIPAYCIHLLDRTDREETMKKELPKIHNNVKIFPGIRLNPGYRGISRSHKSIIIEAKKNGYPYVIIMEDDIKICSDKSKAAFQNAIRTLPDDWDLLLGGVYDGRNVKQIKPGLATVENWCSLHLVLIRSTMYDIILSHGENSHIDRFISGKKQFKHYITYPFVAIQYNGHSDNVNRKVNYDHYLKKFKLLT